MTAPIAIITPRRRPTMVIRIHRQHVGIIRRPRLAGLRIERRVGELIADARRKVGAVVRDEQVGGVGEVAAGAFEDPEAVLETLAYREGVGVGGCAFVE